LTLWALRLLPIGVEAPQHNVFDPLFICFFAPVSFISPIYFFSFLFVPYELCEVCKEISHRFRVLRTVVLSQFQTYSLAVHFWSPFVFNMFFFSVSFVCSFSWLFGIWFALLQGLSFFVLMAALPLRHFVPVSPCLCVASVLLSLLALLGRAAVMLLLLRFVSLMCICARCCDVPCVSLRVLLCVDCYSTCRLLPMVLWQQQHSHGHLHEHWYSSSHAHWHRHD